MYQRPMTKYSRESDLATGILFKLICNSMYNDFMTQHSQIKSKNMLNASSTSAEAGNFSIRSVVPPIYACKVDLLNYKIYLAEAFSCKIEELPNFVFCVECIFGFTSPTIIISFLELDCFLNKKTLHVDPKYEAMKRTKIATSNFENAPEFNTSNIIIETRSDDNSIKEVISVDDSSSTNSEESEQKSKSKTAELKSFIHDCVTSSDTGDLKLDMRIIFLIYKQWCSDNNKGRRKYRHAAYNDYDDFAEEFDYLLKSNKLFKYYSQIKSKNRTSCRGINVCCSNIPNFIYGKIEKNNEEVDKTNIKRRKLYR